MVSYPFISRLAMRYLLLSVVLSAALAGCTEKSEPTPKSSAAGKAAPMATTPAEKPSAGDAAAGKAVAERECKACHGLDGKGVAPGIPHLAAQRDRYLLLALTEYKDVKRTHAALRELAGRLNPTELRNVVAYYASQPPPSPASGKDSKQATLAEKGKALASACEKCHGEEGNSTTPGVPSLAGQQPHYLVTAIQEYHRGDRGTAAMKAILRDASRLELESLALYFASRTPAQRSAPSRGDPAAGRTAHRDVRRVPWPPRRQQRCRYAEPRRPGPAVPDESDQGVPDFAPALGHAAFRHGH